MPAVRPPASLLIVRLGAIGDVIHTLPVLTLLRERLPDARIGWFVESGAAPLLEGAAGLDALHVWPRKAWRREGVLALRRRTAELMRGVRAEGWEVALDVQGLLRSGFVAWRSGARRRVGFRGDESRELNGAFMTAAHRPPAALRHVIERNLFLAAAAMGADDLVAEARDDAEDFAERARGLWRRPVLGAFEAARARVQEMTGNDPRRLVVLNPGGAWASKRWAPERFGELVARVARRYPGGVRFAITYAPDERPLAEAIRAAAQAGGDVPASIFAGLPPTSLQEVAVLCRRAALFVAGDTGPLHLAAHHGVPCVALYGGSDPARNGPYGVAARVLDAQAGRGPGAAAGERVPYRRDTAGLAALTVEAVAEAAIELLDAGRRRATTGAGR